MNRIDTIPLGRKDAVAPAGLPRMPETLLDIPDASVADALDDHFGFAGAAEFLLPSAGLHADHPHVLLTAPRTTDTTKVETAP